MIALVDGNNFFVSCERVFNPYWNNRPLLVLSNNDGCVIARSNEVKKLGIKMGTPAFQIIDLIKEYGIGVYSGNQNLYGLDWRSVSRGNQVSRRKLSAVPTAR